jgi:hypothetical protein
MSKTIRILKCTFILFFVLFMATNCASITKNKVNFKTKKSSCSLAQLVGPDTYYYSNHYQIKLKKTTKRIDRKSRIFVYKLHMRIPKKK